MFNFFYSFQGIAPNLLTLIALMFSLVCCFVMVYTCPNLTEEPPVWALITSCICLFVYQTLDALDGKQARRTGSSSPLGQLFDHGCDSLTATLVSVAAACCLGCGNTIWTMIAALGVQLPVLVLNWYEVHAHIFLTSTGEFGVSEGQFAVMFFLLSTALLGRSFWLTQLCTMPAFLVDITETPVIEFRHAFCAFFIVSSAKMLYDTIPCGFAKSENKTLAFKQLISFFVYFFTAMCLFFTGVYTRFGAFAWFMCAVNFSSMATRLVICATIKKEFKPVQWPLIPFYMMVAALFWIDRYPGLNESVNVILPKQILPFVAGTVGSEGILHLKDVIYLSQCIWCFIYFQDFIRTTIDDICRCVGIFAFNLERRTPQDYIEGEEKKKTA